MRIAFVSYYFPEYCIRHVNEMVKEADVLLMMPSSQDSENLAMLDSRVRFEPFQQPRMRQPIRQLRTVLSMLGKLKKFAPDVVHYQHGHLYFNLALPRVRKYPLVVTIHDARQHVGDKESKLTPQSIMDFGYRRADHVIVHGQSLIGTVTDDLHIAPSKIHLIPHIAIGEEASTVEHRDDGRTILFFGRIWEYKGLEYLIRSEPKVSAEFPNVRFLIAGKGDDFEQYRRMMVHPKRFEVHNDWISDETRAEMFASSSIVVLPYIEASQSGVIPIAYTHQKPVIATRTGGLPDMVDHGKTGLLVPPRDADALADAILQLLRAPEKRSAMGQAGQIKLRRECAPEVVAKATMDVYRQAIADRKQPRTRPVGVNA